MKRVRKHGFIIALLMVALLSGCSGKTAGNYYKEGLKNFNSGNYIEAEANLGKALEMKTEKAEYYIDYAMTLIMLGKNEEALPFFDKAILNKNNMIVNRNDKLAFRGKGIAYVNNYQFTKAIKQFDKALAINELSDLNMDILYYKGNSEEKAGLYEAALETYTTILKKNSTDAVIYNSRANVYQQLGQYENSLADYDKAISLNKVKYDYYFGKYFLLLETGDEEAATAVLNQAANITKKTQEDNYNQAKILYYMEDYDVAIIELSKAFSDGFTEAYYYLGDIYEKKDDYKSAVYNYKMFIEDEINLKSSSVYNQIGFCLIKLTQYEEALSYIQTGLEHNDVFLEQALKRNEIVAYEKLAKFEEAYLHMTEYLTLYPEDEEAIEEYNFLKTRLQEVSTINETEE